MSFFGYCASWPNELKELSLRHYRAECRVRNLEAAITRIDPCEFDALMDQLELAQQDLRKTGMRFNLCKYAWESQQFGGKGSGCCAGVGDAELHNGEKL